MAFLCVDWIIKNDHLQCRSAQLYRRAGLEFQTHAKGETLVSVVGVVSAYTATTNSEVGVFFIGGLYGISNADEEIV